MWYNRCNSEKQSAQEFPARNFTTSNLKRNGVSGLYFPDFFKNSLHCLLIAPHNYRNILFDCRDAPALWKKSRMRKIKCIFGNYIILLSGFLYDFILAQKILVKISVPVFGKLWYDVSILLQFTVLQFIKARKSVCENWREWLWNRLSGSPVFRIR